MIFNENNQIIKMNNQIYQLGMSSSKCLFSVWYFILKTTSEQFQLEIISYEHSSKKFLISLNLHLYLGLFLTNKCAVFCKL